MESEVWVCGAILDYFSICNMLWFNNYDDQIEGNRTKLWATILINAWEFLPSTFTFMSLLSSLYWEISTKYMYFMFCFVHRHVYTLELYNLFILNTGRHCSVGIVNHPYWENPRIILFHKRKIHQTYIHDVVVISCITMTLI